MKFELRLLVAVVAIVAALLLIKVLDLKVKAGVLLEGVSWRMFWAAIVADTVYQKYDAEAVITSGVDSEHSVHSEHYKGNALDFRTSNVSRPLEVKEALQNALGTSYAVLLESDHIHVQYGWDNVKGGNPYA